MRVAVRKIIVVNSLLGFLSVIIRYRGNEKTYFLILALDGDSGMRNDAPKAISSDTTPRDEDNLFALNKHNRINSSLPGFSSANKCLSFGKGMKKRDEYLRSLSQDTLPSKVSSSEPTRRE